jgi:hypothetical protein
MLLFFQPELTPWQKQNQEYLKKQAEEAASKGENEQAEVFLNISFSLLIFHTSYLRLTFSQLDTNDHLHLGCLPLLTSRMIIKRKTRKA